MDENRKSRDFNRFTLPVIVEAPSISDVALVPEDVSAGGFSFVVEERPEPNSVVDCTLMILDHTFENSRAVVRWARENVDAPGTWLIGLSVQMPGPERELFEKLLNRLLEEIS